MEYDDFILEYLQKTPLQWLVLDYYSTLEEAFAAKDEEVEYDKENGDTFIYRIRANRIIYEG